MNKRTLEQVAFAASQGAGDALLGHLVLRRRNWLRRAWFRLVFRDPVDRHCAVARLGRHARLLLPENVERRRPVEAEEMRPALMIYAGYCAVLAILVLSTFTGA